MQCEFLIHYKKSKQEKEKLISEKSTLVSELKSLEAKLTENKGEVEKLNEKFTKEFENLANKILDFKVVFVSGKLKSALYMHQKHN